MKTAFGALIMLVVVFSIPFSAIGFLLSPFVAAFRLGAESGSEFWGLK